MAVPRNRSSNARKNARRSHHAKSPKHLSKCPNCGSSHAPHKVCGSCGYYKNKAVFKVENQE
jgi:large subunit ribosomal protein L32